MRPSTADTFWCVTTYFNPVGYRSRLETYQIFADSLRRQGVNLLSVELAFGDDPFQLPESDTTLRLRARSVLWQKERLINYACSRLPAECRYLAWMDCDLLCGDDDWAALAVERLQTFHVAQLFEKVIYLPPARRELDVAPVEGPICEPGTYLHSVAWQACSYPDWIDLRRKKMLRYAAPGFGWAMRREVAETFGLYDCSIVGGGDMAFAEAVLNAPGVEGLLQAAGPAWRAHLLEWFGRVAGAGLTCSYIPQDVYHLFHGHTKDRRYSRRFAILREAEFDPRTDIRLVDHVYEWASDKPKMHEALVDYFRGRREDDGELNAGFGDVGIG